MYFINVPETRRAGVEIEANLQLPGHTRLFASYAYVAATYQSFVQIATADTNPEPATPGDVFPSSPLHRGRIGFGITAVTHAALYEAEADVHGYSAQYLRGDESNRRARLPGYALAGVRGSMHWKSYAVTVDIDNLLNRGYSCFGILAENNLTQEAKENSTSSDATVGAFVTPGEPRRIVVTFTITH